CFVAKEKGRDRVQENRLDDEDISRQRHDMDWADRIKECIQEDCVVLYGQRITALQPQHEDGMELIDVPARIQHPDGDLVSPTAFIHAAERFGLSYRLDQRIISEAVAKLQALAARRRDRARYFITISAITLGTPGLSGFLKRLLLDYCDVLPCQV